MARESLHDLVEQLLQHTCGSRVEVLECRVGKQLHDYFVLFVQLRHPTIEVVVKLAGPEASLACPFDRTARIHALVSTQTAIPMAEVVAVDTSYQLWPWRYFIKTLIPGVEWAVAQQQMSPEETSTAYGEMGEAIAQLHTISFPGFGDIPISAGVEMSDSYFNALVEHARAIIKSPRLQELFLSVLEKRRALFLDVQRASLCHEDLHKHNILFERRAGQWRLATILDFEKAWAGHPETDLGRLELWKGMTSRAFWQSYEALQPVEPLYAQRRSVYQLLWCFEYAQPTPEHLTDTQHLCLELGLPRLEGFG